MALILNQSQAEAVYSAMCALNNVSARLNCQFDRALNYVNICEDETGHIRIAGRHGELETYADQSAFATAYGLKQG